VEGASFNGGMKEVVTRRLFLFGGGGRGRLVRSGSVREEEEEGRQVSWQAPSLRGIVFPKIHQGRTWAEQADEGRRQPRKEWAGAVKKEVGGRWGRVVSVYAGR
jgi:hypothetical protein